MRREYAIKQLNRQDVYKRQALMGESERVIHVESLPETMNQVDVAEGRLPEKKGECIIDMDTAASYDIKIGDTLTFLSGTDTELSENLATEEYTVVGTCSSPMYISCLLYTSWRRNRW